MYGRRVGWLGSSHVMHTNLKLELVGRDAVASKKLQANPRPEAALVDHDSNQ